MFGLIKSIFQRGKNPSSEMDRSGLLIDSEINPAREMLKEATALKKEKKYDEACQKLVEAFSQDGANNLSAKERLRLPMYLQLAGKSDEGWRVINEINISLTDVFSQADIADQMRIFLQKEGGYYQALLFCIWSICKEIERDRFNVELSINLSDRIAEQGSMFGGFDKDDENEVYGVTPKGNPITDGAYKMFQNRIGEASSADTVQARIAPLLKKAGKMEVADDIAAKISGYLHSSSCYDLNEVRDIVSNIVGNER